ncbi:hypothetical protein ACMFMG_001482 [Clarireedia jacksonii]
MAAQRSTNVATNNGVVMGNMVASSMGSNNIIVGNNNHLNTGEDPLKLLPFATDARFDSFANQDKSTCLPKTRVDILQKISQWSDTENQQYIYWLSGMAGTGKSTIARTVAQNLLDKKQLGANFFFSRGGGDAGNARKFVTTIAVQLAENIELVRRYIRDAIRAHNKIEGQSLEDQWDKLVIRPLSELKNSYTWPSCVVVIDALDECETETEIRHILRLFVKARSLENVRLRILVTSRPEKRLL